MQTQSIHLKLDLLPTTEEEQQEPAVAWTLVHDGESHRVYKGVLAEDDHECHESGGNGTDKRIAVAVKALKPVPAADISCLYNEYNVLAQLRNTCTGTRAVLKKEKFDANDGYGPQPAVYFEWVEGYTLAEWLAVDRAYPSFEEKVVTRVRLAHGVASALASVHGAGLLHNDLLADNVIVDLTRQAAGGNGSLGRRENIDFNVKLIDLGFAERSDNADKCDLGEPVNDDMHALALLLKSLFSKQHWGEDESSYPNDVGNRLVCGDVTDTSFATSFMTVYQAHTDDGNSSSDRSRSYSSDKLDEMLGLTGSTAIGMEEDGTNLANNLPLSIRRVLADAMDHGPGTRDTAYKDAKEIMEDLEQMVTDPDVFLTDPNGVETTKMTFARPPRRLFGREKEIETLMETCGKLANANRDGGSEVVLVAGHSGTGKSSLLRQLRLSILEKEDCLFAMGKFDQLRQTQPYSALIAAFDEVCEYILTQEEDALAAIREEILSAVGSNGKVLTDVIPKLTKIIGNQPDIPHVRGVAAQNRFKYVFRLFVSAIASPKRHLVFVLDDIQWADSASVDLVHNLVNDETNKHFLFIGCYRDNEMTPDHQVWKQLDEMRNGGTKFTTIELGNMDEDAVSTCVSERLRLPRRLTKSLAEIVHRKTLGNAFFMTQFLLSLAQDGLLKFSNELLRWEWDESAVESKSISDNVVEVMAEKIQSLPASLRNLIKTASCIGSIFDMEVLHELSAMTSPAEVRLEADRGALGNLGGMALAKYIKMLVKQGLINKMRSKARYKFSHDRIQQAAYSLLSESERSELHVQIGRLFHTKLLKTGTTALVFSAADQMNRGIACITDREEQLELARLNARAGEEAFLSCAFTPSKKYLEIALKILGEDHDVRWNEHYGLTLQIYNLLAEVSCCSSEYEESERLVNIIFKNATSFDDKFDSYLSLIKSLVGQGRLDDGLNTGIELVGRLGAALPKTASQRAVNIERLKTKRALRNKTDDFLLTLPEMTDENMMKVMKAMNVFVVIARLVGSKYFAICILRMVQLSLRFGLTKASAVAFSLYGMYLSNLGEGARAYRFGRLSLMLLERLNAKSHFPKAHLFVYAFNYHWHVPVQSVLSPLMGIYEVGLEVGDVEYSGYGILHKHLIELHSGQNIQSLIEQQERCLPTVPKAALDMCLSTYQAALNLAGQSDDPVRLNGKGMNEEELLRRTAEQHSPITEYYFRMNAAAVAYIFCDYDRAAEMACKTRDFSKKFPSTYAVATQAFYDGLISFAMARQTKSMKWRKLGLKVIKKFQKWTKDCPQNNMHKVLLLKAENAALLDMKSKKKKKINAKAAFDAAIASARENGFLNDEAIAHERAALFYADIGEDDLSLGHTACSRELYLAWGAVAKAERLSKAGALVTAKALREEGFCEQGAAA